MANHLKMADVQAIQALRARGWSFRKIGRVLGIHGETVARHVRVAEATANLPVGSQNRPNPPTGHSGPASRCKPFHDSIVSGLEQGLSYQRIWQDLREGGFADGYDSVKRYARRLAEATPLPFRRMECEPGAEAQVDFGTGAPVIVPDGQRLPAGVKTRRRRTHAFRIVLSVNLRPTPS